ncbi:hypothetical protein PL2TA16_00078, partial [Pseudoalteromonas luteoviolacea 2ta16]
LGSSADHFGSLSEVSVTLGQEEQTAKEVVLLSNLTLATNPYQAAYLLILTKMALTTGMTLSL